MNVASFFLMARATFLIRRAQNSLLQKLNAGTLFKIERKVRRSREQLIQSWSQSPSNPCGLDQTPPFCGGPAAPG